MTLTATSRPRRRSRARYTVAMPPWPISSISSYFSSSGLRPESAVNRAPSAAPHSSWQLLHPNGIGRTPNTHTSTIYHNVALAGLDEAVIHQNLTSILHLFFQAWCAADQRTRRNAPIERQPAQRAVVRGERHDGRRRARLGDQAGGEPGLGQRHNQLGPDFARDRARGMGNRVRRGVIRLRSRRREEAARL